MKRKPRIAFIVPDKIKNPVGGIGVQAKYTIKHLEHDFDIDTYGFPEQNGLANYHSVFNPMPKIQHGGLNTLIGQISYMSELCKHEKPDLVHASDYTVFLAGVMAAKTFNIPLVVSMQLSPHVMERVGIINAYNVHTPDGAAIHNSLKEMEMLGLHEAHTIIHVSTTYKKLFSTLPGIDTKSVYIPNGVDIDEWSNFSKVTLPGHNKIKLVYLGRFTKEKNIHNLLQVHIPPNIDLIFIGEQSTSEPDLFAQIMQKTSAPNIFYIGPAYNQDKINILHSATAVIIPSLYECQPLVMFEALASKSVILSSFVSDMGVILNETCSIHCGTTPETIHNALLRLSRMSNEEIQARVDMGYEIAKKYTWEKSAQLIKEVYNRLL